MSEKLSESNRLTNEEIIDDLTNDFKISISETNEEFVIKPETRTDELPSSSGDAPFTRKTDFPVMDNPHYDENYEKDHLEQEIDSDTDSVDEESLKDSEIDLTDDQKEERRIIAEGLKMAGNNAFKDAEYERSIEKYTEGLKICPLQFSQLRAILYCNRSAAKMKLEKFKHAIKDCSKALDLDDKYIKAYLRRAQSYESTEKFDESLADFKKILELDASHKEAQKALTRLPPLIEEKNEKLKREMFGKLKDLGNMILRPFGLSTENFQMEQDPETKGYKINFK